MIIWQLCLGKQPATPDCKKDIMAYLIHLICGSTGAGKTTYTMDLAARLGAVRFSIDDWMTGLFWMDSPEPIEYEWAMERINRCEAQIWDTVLQLTEKGTPCILDLGLTKREHRAKFTDLATRTGLSIQLHFVDVSLDERWARVEQRNKDKGATYRLNVSRENFDFVENMWEAPDEVEMKALNGIRVS